MKPLDQDESLLRFPCRFPIKAMGSGMIGIEETVFSIVQLHAPEVSKQDMKIRPSRNGRYMSVTITINADSRAQLDAIYYALSEHDDIMMAF